MELSEPSPPSSLETLSPNALIRKSSVVYGVMTAIALALIAFGHKSLSTVLSIPDSPEQIGRLVLIGALGAGLLLVPSYFFEDWFQSFRELKSMIVKFLGPASVLGAIYLAIITAIGEELFFRGALQPFAGVVLTSVLFGLLHMGQNSLVSAWSIWALIAGLLLGWMFEETGSLWPPIVAHFGVNVVSILRIRRTYQTYTQHVESATLSASTGEGKKDNEKPPRRDS